MPNLILSRTNYVRICPSTMLHILTYSFMSLLKCSDWSVSCSGLLIAAFWGTLFYLQRNMQHDYYMYKHENNREVNTCTVTNVYLTLDEDSYY